LTPSPFLWDSYPAWQLNPEGDFREALTAAFDFDLMRSLRHEPFLLIESTPAALNWKQTMAQKPPGLHLLSSIQAVAHGSQSVMYFQWRKGRGAFEKFHGAVVDHAGADTRIFREVADVGRTLQELQPIFESTVKADVAIVYDWDNLWALECASGPCNNRFRFNFEGVKDGIRRYYDALKLERMNVEFVRPTDDLSPYRLVIAPLLYLLRDGAAENLDRYVAQGGNLLGTYLTGQVDQNDLCFLGGFPGPLRDTFGVWAEETHSMPDFHAMSVSWEGRELPVEGFAERLHCLGSSQLARFTNGLYADLPALTSHRRGEGKAWYLGAELKPQALGEVLSRLLDEAGCRRLLTQPLPDGVYVSSRELAGTRYLFVMNFAAEPRPVELEEWEEFGSGEPLASFVVLPGYSYQIFQQSV